jgi:hypothetical protein
MTRTLTVTWEAAPGDPHRVTYFVDEFPVGEDDVGFDRILDLIRADDNTDVILRILASPSLGGGPLIESFPFRRRLGELHEALGDNALTYEFS